MSATQPFPGQLGGAGAVRMPVLDEIQFMSGHFLLIFLILVSVYVSRIPHSTMMLFKHPVVQLLSLSTIFLITAKYGWIHGIIAALAVALVLTRAKRTQIPSSLSSTAEGMADYIPAALVIEDQDTTVIPQNHRWFVEKVLGENPFIIREKEVKTTAVQDLSERSMGSSSVTR